MPSIVLQVPVLCMSIQKRPLNIAVIPGDGIGKEVVPEGLRVLEAAAEKFNIEIDFDHFDFASCDYFAGHGQMMPDDWKARIGGHDAIFFGAVGWPDTVPDHVSLWGSLIQFRREFDQYVNLRPVRLMPGVRAPPMLRLHGVTLSTNGRDLLKAAAVRASRCCAGSRSRRR